MSQKLKNIPPLSTMEPPLLPQSWRLDTNGSFELNGVGESLGELELRYTQTDPL